MEKIKLCGLDTSSRCSGYSYFENGELIEHGVVDLGKFKGSSDERIREMGRGLLKALQKYDPDIVVIEEEVIGSSTTTRMLAMIIGIVMSWTIAKNREFHMLQPSQWRSLVCNEGESYPRKREDAKAWDISKCKEFFGIDVGDDEADGILIGKAYIRKYGG